MIVQDDCRSVLPKLPDRSVDAIICDPPYELKRDRRGAGFMGQTWDSDSGAFDARTWEQIRRVAKPGAWVAAFGGRRTWHRLACAMEDGGLIPRDTFIWAYSTGNVTAPHTTVKPVFEPICVMQVPAEGSLAASVDEYGTGYLGIDESRIPYLDDADLAKTVDLPNREDVVEQIAHLPESGGTVGPLPDGTVIEVEPIPTDGPDPRRAACPLILTSEWLAMSEQERCDAFNAREES